jgi:high-affinity K+ transport system ATPase subunit B
MCCLGATSVFASQVPGADIDVMGSSDPASAMTMGLVFLCLSFIFILIPIAVGFFTLRKKPETIASDEPLPPVS